MKRIETIIDLLEDVKAKEVKAFDYENRSPYYQYVILATANNRQANAFIVSLKRENLVNTEKVEGRNTGWTLVDLGDIIVHLFDEQMRKYYNFDDKMLGLKNLLTK